MLSGLGASTAFMPRERVDVVQAELSRRLELKDRASMDRRIESGNDLPLARCEVADTKEQHSLND